MRSVRFASAFRTAGAFAVRTAGLRPASLTLPFSSTGIPACATSRYAAVIANARRTTRHRSFCTCRSYRRRLAGAFESAVSSVGARHAVPERAIIAHAPHSTINPTHSFASSHRTREATINLRHRQDCLCYSIRRVGIERPSNCQAQFFHPTVRQFLR